MLVLQNEFDVDDGTKSPFLNEYLVKSKDSPLRISLNLILTEFTHF